MSHRGEHRRQGRLGSSYRWQEPGQARRHPWAAPARSGPRHLWLLRRCRSTTILGIVLLVSGMAYFYLIPLWVAGPWGPPDPADGMATWATAALETLPGARNINDT